MSTLQKTLGWPQVTAFALLMLIATVLAIELTPHESMARAHANIQLERDIPRQLQNWRVDDRQVLRVVNPQQTELVQALYSQSLSRIYINEQGQRVMLSISYGEKQSGGVELHRPEVCYPAQGFKLESQAPSWFKAPNLAQPIMLTHLIGRDPRYNEAISYWMRVGNDLMTSGWSQQFARIRYGLKGFIPDGVLFRVSSVSDDAPQAYALQTQFLQALFASTPPHIHQFLVGPGPTSSPPTSAP